MHFFFSLFWGFLKNSFFSICKKKFTNEWRSLALSCLNIIPKCCKHLVVRLLPRVQPWLRRSLGLRMQCRLWSIVGREHRWFVRIVPILELLRFGCFQWSSSKCWRIGCRECTRLDASSSRPWLFFFFWKWKKNEDWEKTKTKRGQKKTYFHRFLQKSKVQFVGRFGLSFRRFECSWWCKTIHSQQLGRKFGKILEWESKLGPNSFGFLVQCSCCILKIRVNTIEKNREIKKYTFQPSFQSIQRLGCKCRSFRRLAWGASLVGRPSFQSKVQLVRREMLRFRFLESIGLLLEYHNRPKHHTRFWLVIKFQISKCKWSTKGT